MKVAHLNKEEPEPITVHDWLARAKEAETAGDAEAAARAYEKVIRLDRLHEFAYNRLMIIYRKLKEYQKELKVIDAGIAAYQTFFASHKKKKSKKITDLSLRLSKAAGLTDKKGNSLYAPEPVGRWKKRKAVVEKRL
ncbi:MAG: hypothetical protein ABW019_09975 [Chitinophagaceae bacterium]